jgi:eukaryotic-like serine/threonine-protein kinase
MSKTGAKRWGYMLGIAVGIIFVTAFLIGQVILPLVIGRPKKVETPQLIGVSLAQAKRMLNDLNLHAVVEDSLYSETAKLDEILDQSPSFGIEIKEEGTVHLVISKGSKMVRVPDVRGSSFQEAMVMLRNYDLRSTIVDSLYDDSVERNAVLRSNPAAGVMVEKKSLIRLILSRGQEALPDSLETEDYFYPEY